MVNPPSLIMSYIGQLNTFADTVQQYWPIAQTFNTVVLVGIDEASAQEPFVAGTASKLWCRVITGTSTGSSTMVLRKNKANGTMSVSIAQGATGAFTDASNSDSISGGDLVCYGITPGDVNLVLTITAFTFVATTAGNTVTKLGFIPLWGGTTIGNLTTYYLIPSGMSGTQSNIPPTTTEGNAKIRLRKAMTAKNMSWYSPGGSSTGTNTVKSRKNAADGVLTFTTSGTTAKLNQDTTHSDSLAIGDDYNISIIGGNPSWNGTYAAFGIDLVSTNGDCMFVCGNDGLTQFNTSVTNYFGLSGGLDTPQTTETPAKVTVNSAFQFSELCCNITSNGISSNPSCTITLRANAGNAGSVAISATNGQTGVLSDSSHTYTASTTDEMNYKVATGAAGTNLQISFIEVYGNATAGAAAGGPSYQNFGSRSSRNQKYKSFGNQMIIFG